MKKGKLIAGIIWLALGALLVILLLNFIQRLLISGLGFIDELGNTIVAEDTENVSPTAQPTVDPSALFSADDFDGEPMETAEPEELFIIPVEETAEELARENESGGDAEE